MLPKHVWSQHTGHKGNDLKSFAEQSAGCRRGTVQPDQVPEGPDRALPAQRQVLRPEAAGRRIRPADVLERRRARRCAQAPRHRRDRGRARDRDQDLRSSGFTIKQVPGFDHTDFIINSNPKKTKHRELLDPRVKTAMDYAIDRSQIVRVVFLGAAHPGNSIITPSSGAWYNPAVKPTPFNLAKANQILDWLGYKKGSDGIRVANGSKMSYAVITPTDVHSIQRTFQIIQAAFRKIGIQIEAEVARLERRVRRDHRAERQVHRLRSLDVGLGRTGRPRLHALGRHVRAVRRLVGQRLLRQEIRRDVLQAAAHAGPDEAARDRVADAGVPAEDEARTSGSRTSTT